MLKGIGTVSGTVTQKETGKPVEAARVRGWGPGGAILAEAATDEQGRYTMTVTEGSIGSLTAEKEGLAPAEDPGRAQSPMVLREGEALTRDLVMREGARLSGVVKGPDGPLPGVRVSVQSPPGGGNQKSAVTDSEGLYRIESLVPGIVLVRPEKEGFYVRGLPDFAAALQQPDGLPTFRVELLAGTQATKDLEMAAGGVVEGCVEGPDGPLAGVRVATSGMPAEGGVVTRADGAFRLEPVRPGSNVGLHATKEGFASVGLRPVAVAEDAPTTGVVIRMRRLAVVRGTVTTADGIPHVDAQVRVGHGNDPGPWYFQNAGPPAPVRPDGSFEVSLRPGDTERFRVAATAAGHAPAFSAPVAFVEGREVYVVNLTLDVGRDLEGLVLDKRGRAPVAGAAVAIAAIHRPGGTWWNQGRPVWATSDVEGRFRVGHLAAGTYDVLTTADGYLSSNATVNLAAANQVTVELDPELAIEGTVVYPDGRPVEGAAVNASRQGGGGGGSTTGRGGLFRIGNLVAGSYRVRVSAGGTEVNVRQTDSEPIAAGTSAARIVVEAGGAIEGRVRDARGRPVVQASVSARPEATGDPRNTQTRADGTFALLGLGTGTYTVGVSAGNWTGLRPFETRGVPVGTTNLDVVLEEGLVVAGTVVDAGGRPFASVQLVCRGPRGDLKTQTGSDGSFAVGGLAPGMYAVVLVEGGPTAGLVLDDAGEIPAGTRGLRLVASRGLTITGWVVDDAGSPVRNVQVSATSRGPPAPARSAQSRADGSFELTGLVAGTTYTVTARQSGRTSATLSDAVPGSTGVRLVCGIGLSSSGRIVDETGPVKGAAVTLTLPGDGTQRQQVRTDDDGRFTVAGLVDGHYQVSVQRPRGAVVCGTIQAGQHGVALTVPR